MGNPILDIRDLHVWYRTYGGYSKVLDGVNLFVHQGEKVGLVGEAGCGKTTTMRSVLRILPEGQAHTPRGQILYHGKNILQMNRRELHQVRTSGVSMIFQEPAAALNPVFTVGTQITDVIKFSGLGKPEKQKDNIKNLAMQAIREVYIADPERIMSSYPNQLSGGMKQRICIAMAIVTARELLIADEPGTALDVTIQDQVHKLLRGLVEKKGMSLVMITHSLGVAREMTDRIYVMYAGNIVEVAKSGELFRNPLHPYTLGLLESVPKLTGGGMAEGIYGQIPDYLRPPDGCRFHPRCPRAVARCREEKPNLADLGDGHQVACFQV
ncbi:peptide/nickel transport system ATP-binding protein [Desulfotomaculum arcticum]|uniref:Nickel import system ATP-binding protein NikD n=1 Tax=Desulfotruncus arcticus DSM 17038 TaxID=1121424 RepID=A0A1I2RJJ9_9FIRM|nr:peptide/nickel transport system ATP-binding protein [Desulfotomaculum arcticum] [Desulfotruncus arcticus DSM 17038]